MLLKALPGVIFRYVAKSSVDPWRIAYDAKSEMKPSNFPRALMRARTKKPRGVESNDDPKGHVCNAAALEHGGALRFDGLKGKSFSGPFRSRSNRFEDRATSWRRDTAHRRICARVPLRRNCFGLGC